MVFWNTSSFNRYFKVDKIKQVHWALTYSVLKNTLIVYIHFSCAHECFTIQMFTLSRKTISDKLSI